MTDLRALLDSYGTGHELVAGGRMAGQVQREMIAPKAFAALRAVMETCDFLDTCIADYKGYEVAALIRNGITKALEAR